MPGFRCIGVGPGDARRLLLLLGSILVGLALLAALPRSAAFAAVPDQVGEWGPVLDFGVPATHQVLMRTGKVLFWRAGDEARVWDPITGQLADTPSPFPPASSNFHCGAHVVLFDGRVLAIGGGDSPHVGHHATATFDPVTMKWTQLPDLTSPRWYPTATMLSDGRVLVGNGEDANGVDVDTFEIYDPAANTWTQLSGADRNQDIYASNYLLPDGKIFEAGPRVATALLDLTTHSWTAGPDSYWKTGGYSESGAMYRPGKIIRSGGTTSKESSTNGATNRAEIVDMTTASPAWEEVGAMAFPRRRHNMVILADGEVMAVGGTEQGDDPDQAVLAGEIWNPDTKQWTTVASMSKPRQYHSAALLLPDGRVLAAGGEPSTVTGPVAQTAQVYSPPYLFKGPRPTISAASATAGYGSTFSVNTTDSATIDSVALIRPSAVTHTNNMEQRYVALPFTRGNGSLSVTAPASGNIAPPGWYMLVVKDGNGVPSVAKWIQIGQGLAAGSVPPPTPGSSGGTSGSGVSAIGGTDLAAGSTDPLQAPTGGGSPGGTSGDPRTTHGEANPPARARVLDAVVTPGRSTLRSIHRHGLGAYVRINPWGDASARVIRLRLYRVRPGHRRRLIASRVRSLRRPQALRLALPTRTLRRRVHPGRYRLEIAFGRDLRRTGPPVRRALVVGR